MDTFISNEDRARINPATEENQTLLVAEVEKSTATSRIASPTKFD